MTAGTRRDFSGKAVFVSGASSGLGEAAARLFAERGAAVTLFARRRARLDAIAGEIETCGGRALAVPGDVRSSADVERAIAATEEHFGAVDVAVANAGIGRARALEQLTDADWAAYIDTNLTGVFYVCRGAGLRMKAAGNGVIVTIASGLGLVGMSGYAAYCASKGGVVLLTRALAAELAPHVRVNCLCPGGVETPMTDDDFGHARDPEAARRKALERVPLKRLASAEEIAGAIAWLASEEAAYATGAVVSIDGGTTMV